MHCTDSRPWCFLQIKTYNQLLVVRNKYFCTAYRQVSRLKDHHVGHLPSFPVIYRLSLPDYGDEFVQDLHLFPFSPKPMLLCVFCIVLTPVAIYSIVQSITQFFFLSICGVFVLRKIPFVIPTLKITPPPTLSPACRNSCPPLHKDKP